MNTLRESKGKRNKGAFPNLIWWYLVSHVYIWNWNRYDYAMSCMSGLMYTHNS